MPTPLRGRAEAMRLRAGVDRAFERYDRLQADESELRADFANYLCVSVAGFFEKALVALVVELARQRSAPEVVSFVESHMNRFQNANSQRLAELLGSMSEEWRRKVETYLGQDGRGEALGSLVSLRHRIAHGDPSTGSTYARIKDYYDKILEVVDFVADLLLPRTPR